jgi:hypothetical protein
MRRSQVKRYDIEMDENDGELYEFPEYGRYVLYEEHQKITGDMEVKRLIREAQLNEQILRLSNRLRYYESEYGVHDPSEAGL